MEAHAGTIGIRTGHTRKPGVGRLAQIRDGISKRRQQRARRAYAMRMNGSRPSFVAGSEHTHLLRRPRGF
jgi:CCAAT-binding transcription factor (CBF-B/NF-YA) subunit B